MSPGRLHLGATARRGGRVGPREWPLAFVAAAALALVVLVGCGRDDGGGGSATVPTATTLPPLDYALVRVADLDRPVTLAPAPDGRRLYVGEQQGRIFLVDPQTGDAEVVWDQTDITGDPAEYVEAGVLGLAVDPTGEHLYVSDAIPVPQPDADRAVERRVIAYRLGDDGHPLADTATVILTMTKLRPVHNGGEVAFGPDGALYTSIGDGWPFADGLAVGQDPHSLLGTIVRILPEPGGDAEAGAGAEPTLGVEVDEDADAGSGAAAGSGNWSGSYAIPADNPFADGGGAPEVWTYGLRNPWRFAWDPVDDALWIVDVGQDQREEINRVEAGRAPGVNFGWSVLEGTVELDDERQPPEARDVDDATRSNFVDPVHEYDHDQGCAVVGGAVVRGGRYPDLEGAFLFGDFCRPVLQALVPTTGGPNDAGDVGRQDDLGGADGGDDEAGAATGVPASGGGPWEVVPVAEADATVYSIELGHDGVVYVLSLDGLYRLEWPGTASD